MKTYSDVLGNDATPQEMIVQWARDAADTGESLPKWIERQSSELWGNEHDPDDDWNALAADLNRSANLPPTFGTRP